MKTSFASLLLAMTFLTVTACGQNQNKTVTDETNLNEEQTAIFDGRDESLTEEEMIAADGTGETPADLLGGKLSDGTDDEFSVSEKSQVLSKYSHLDPGHVVPTALLQKAVTYFEANQSRFANKNYISVIDFSKKSTKARFWIINLKSGAVWAIHTSHGKGSDTNHDGYAESFSNVSGSNKSSLGFYRTGETYSGKHGLSLRLDGLSTTNSKARSRAVVIHSATYVSESSVIQGRSNGCPAVAPGNRDQVISKLKNGSLIYAGLSGVR